MAMHDESNHGPLTRHFKIPEGGDAEIIAITICTAALKDVKDLEARCRVAEYLADRFAVRITETPK